MTREIRRVQDQRLRSACASRTEVSRDGFEAFPVPPDEHEMRLPGR